MNNDDDKPPVIEDESISNVEPTAQPETSLEAATELDVDTDIGIEPTVEPVIVPVPVVAPTTPPVPVVETAEVAPANPKEANTPGVIILQWLSYAFWGWLIIALIWLVSVILTNAILGTSIISVVPYAIAAGVVLLPIAFLTDFFYRKHEPTKKTGVAMVIMVIHAVLFALLAIVALIVTVFNSINAVIEASSSIDGLLVTIFTAMAATLLYAAAFIRVLNPFKTKKAVFIYSAAMVGLTLILIALTIVGPLVKTIATKDDRRIEQNLSSVSQGINDYIETNKKLPTGLSQVSFDNNEASLLTKDNLVNYKTETPVVNSYDPSTIEYRYQLCVTFKEKDGSGYTYTSSSYGSNDYATYLSTSRHGKGEVCYKLSKSVTQTGAGLNIMQLEGSVLNKN